MPTNRQDRTRSTISARALPLTPRTQARNVMATEYAALIAMVDQLTPPQWSAATDCTLWQVRDMLAHCAGAAEETVRFRTNLRHLLAAQRGLRRDTRGGPIPTVESKALVDCLGEVQIADRAALTDAELFTDLKQWAARSPDARLRTPSVLRRMKLPASSGLRPGSDLGYLLDVIGPRDVWMHRVDLSRATGVPMAMSAGESEVVAQVIRDLALDWDGPEFELALTGRGGGCWVVGAGPTKTVDAPSGRISGHRLSVTADAVALLRLLSGRPGECVLDAQGDARVEQVVVERLQSVRVAF